MVLCILVVCNIYSWSDDDVMLSINSLVCCDVSKLKRSILKSPIRSIFLFCSLLRFSDKGLTQWPLTHFSPMSHFYIPWKRQKTTGVEMWHWLKWFKGAYVHWKTFLNTFHNYVTAFIRKNCLNKKLFKVFSLEIVRSGQIL